MVEEGEPPLGLSPVARPMEELMEDACRAGMAGDLEKVKAALGTAQEAYGSAYSVDGAGRGGRSPLYQACLGRQPEVVSRSQLERQARELDAEDQGRLNLRPEFYVKSCVLHGQIRTCPCFSFSVFRVWKASI